jgi:hypothetical protein
LLINEDKAEARTQHRLEIRLYVYKTIGPQSEHVKSEISAFELLNHVAAFVKTNIKSLQKMR